MNFERLEQAWRSSANSPTAAAVAYLSGDAADELKARRQKLNLFTALIAVLLTGWTLKLGYDALTRAYAFDVTREWSVILLAALPWIALLMVRRGYERHLRAHPDPYASMARALAALADENFAAQRRVRAMALIMAFAVGVLAIALWQLVGVGKMTVSNAMQGAALFGSVLTIVWGSIAIDYFRRLKPEGARLNQLLSDFADG